jgi:acetyl esterase/lipase
MRYVAISLLHTDMFTHKEQRFMSPPTGEAIIEYCNKHDLKLESTRLEVGRGLPAATVHEVRLGAQPKQGAALLYVHGGGYINAIAGMAMIPLALECAKSARADTLFFLEYTLAPELRYPGQLVQASAAVNFLLGDRGIKPEDLVIGGESAGGNIVLAVLAHIQKKHPDIPAIQGISLQHQLKGVFLPSPWVSNKLATESYRQNAAIDYLNATKMQNMIDHWRPAGEVWADQLLVDSTFWTNLPVKRILVTGGTWEVFADDIWAIGKSLEDAGADVQVFRAEREIHAQPVVDMAVQMPPQGSGEVLSAWLGNL